MKGLATVPKDLNSAYDDVMSRIEKSWQGERELAKTVLSWVFRAQRMLTMRELLEVMAVEKGEDLMPKYMFKPGESDCLST